MSLGGAFDYAIAGGGLSGCVLASHLKEHDQSLSIALIEAGLDEHQDPKIMGPLASPTLHGTPLEWNDKSVPQTSFGTRQIDMFGGRVLSGFSAVN